MGLGFDFGLADLDGELLGLGAGGTAWGAATTGAALFDGFFALGDAVGFSAT